MANLVIKVINYYVGTITIEMKYTWLTKLIIVVFIYQKPTVCWKASSILCLQINNLHNYIEQIKNNEKKLPDFFFLVLIIFMYVVFLHRDNYRMGNPILRKKKKRYGHSVYPWCALLISGGLFRKNLSAASALQITPIKCTS